MIGIYQIRNKITGQCYIGQSRDIMKRWSEHIHHKKTLIGSEIAKYGIDNFEFSVLKQCKAEDLDRYEEQYISAHGTIYNGYNQVPGGHAPAGEANPHARMTEQEVYAIREAYKNHEYKWGVYEKYKHKLTPFSFSSLWQGGSWKHVHMDVYTEENKQYYMKETSLGENGKDSIFSNFDVINMRYMYIDHTAKEIYEILHLQDKCEFQTLQQILWGRAYGHLPIYDKRNKHWTNCICVGSL